MGEVHPPYFAESLRRLKETVVQCPNLKPATCTSLGLSFPKCIMGMIKVPTSQDQHTDEKAAAPWLPLSSQ